MKDEEFYSVLEATLSARLGLERLGRGHHTIRNLDRARENELFIEYILLVVFDRFPLGKGGLVTIKYAPIIFRWLTNPEKLTTSIFSLAENGGIKDYYSEDNFADFSSLLPAIGALNLIDHESRITLDGTFYWIRLYAANTITIEANNPKHESWKELIDRIWETGGEMAERSGIKEMGDLFG